MKFQKMQTENILKKIQLEKIRLEIYNDTIHDIDEEFFNYVNDTLTTISNRLTFDIPQSIEVLDYK